MKDSLRPICPGTQGDKCPLSVDMHELLTLLLPPLQRHVGSWKRHQRRTILIRRPHTLQNIDPDRPTWISHHDLTQPRRTDLCQITRPCITPADNLSLRIRDGRCRLAASDLLYVRDVEGRRCALTSTQRKRGIDGRAEAGEG